MTIVRRDNNGASNFKNATYPLQPLITYINTDTSTTLDATEKTGLRRDLNGEIKTAPAYTLALALMELVILSILLTLLLPTLGALWSTIATICSLLTVIGFNYFCWQNMLVVPLASPLLSLFFIFLGNCYVISG